jgi:hypothetical protein
MWQARRARYPRMELELIHTRAQGIRMVYLEVRNRGDYPVRIVTAGASGPRVGYQFMPDGIEMIRSGQEDPIVIYSGDKAIIDAASSGQMSPIPGIILARDAGARCVWDEMSSTLPDDLKTNSELRRDIATALEQELIGWVTVSTGEFFESKPTKFDWVNFKKI